MNEKGVEFKSLEEPVLERERKICCFPVLLRRKQPLFSGQEFFGHLITLYLVPPLPEQKKQFLQVLRVHHFVG